MEEGRRHHEHLSQHLSQAACTYLLSRDIVTSRLSTLARHLRFACRLFVDSSRHAHHANQHPHSCFPFTPLHHVGIHSSRLSFSGNSLSLHSDISCLFAWWVPLLGRFLASQLGVSVPSSSLEDFLHERQNTCSPPFAAPIDILHPQQLLTWLCHGRRPLNTLSLASHLLWPSAHLSHSPPTSLPALKHILPPHCYRTPRWRRPQLFPSCVNLLFLLLFCLSLKLVVRPRWRGEAEGRPRLALGMACYVELAGVLHLLSFLNSLQRLAWVLWRSAALFCFIFSFSNVWLSHFSQASLFAATSPQANLALSSYL